MKYILPILISFVLTVPVKAETILQSIEDSSLTEYHNMILDKSGRVRDMVNKVYSYTYLNNQGEKIVLPYKVKCLVDNRPWDKKVPKPIQMVVMVLNHIQIVIPL